MTSSTLVNDIRRYCKANADPVVVQKYARYFKEGYEAYGLRNEAFECKLKSLLSNRKITLQLVLDSSPALLQSGRFEETSFAIQLLAGFASHFTKKTFSRIEKWFDVGISNWAHADSLSLDIISYFLINRIVPYEELAEWRFSTNKYQRRVVPVSMITLLGIAGRYWSLFQFIQPLMMDEKREVQQGVGWFLREAWKRRQSETERFLLKWKDRSPRLIYQYATEKMTVRERSRFRREK